MSKVYLVQLLCPQRHCVIAAAFEEGKDTPENVIAKMNQNMKEFKINRWCGLCGSPKLAFESAPTKFNSMAEASAALFEEMAKQMITRAVAENDNLPKN